MYQEEQICTRGKNREAGRGRDFDVRTFNSTSCRMLNKLVDTDWRETATVSFFSLYTYIYNSIEIYGPSTLCNRGGGVIGAKKGGWDSPSSFFI